MGPGGGLTLRPNFVPNAANADVSAFRKWDEDLSAKIRLRRTDEYVPLFRVADVRWGLGNLAEYTFSECEAVGQCCTKRIKR